MKPERLRELRDIAALPLSSTHVEVWITPDELRELLDAYDATPINIGDLSGRDADAFLGGMLGGFAGTVLHDFSKRAAAEAELLAKRAPPPTVRRKGKSVLQDFSKREADPKGKGKR